MKNIVADQSKGLNKRVCICVYVVNLFQYILGSYISF